MSPVERKEQKRIGLNAAKKAIDNSHLWNQAVSEIGASNNRKTAKAIYKKYANLSLHQLGYVYNPDNPGDSYYKPKNTRQ